MAEKIKNKKFWGMSDLFKDFGMSSKNAGEQVCLVEAGFAKNFLEEGPCNKIDNSLIFDKEAHKLKEGLKINDTK